VKQQGALLWLLNFCNAGTATKAVGLFPLGRACVPTGQAESEREEQEK